MIPKWPFHVYLSEMRKLTSYRAEFWIQSVGSIAVSIFVAYALWKGIFVHTQATQIGGYTFEGMILYYSLVPFTIRCIQANEMGNISPDIYDGSFTRYLVLPLSALEYKYLANLATATLGLLQFALGFAACLLIFKMPPEIKITFLSLSRGVLTMLLASMLFYFMAATLELIAFWTDNVWSLLVMLRMTSGILGGALIPISLFPEGLRSLLYKLPFSYLASFPVKTILGELSFEQWTQGMGIMIAWILFFYFLSRVIMRRGLLRYTGVGI